MSLAPRKCEPLIEPPNSRAATSAQAQALQDNGAPFKRDRLTLFSYLLYGFWSLAWGLFSPVMPFLRAELRLNYSTAALHFSALALGLLVAGAVGARILNKAEPARVITWSTASIGIALIFVLLAPNHYCTILPALLIGFGGSVASQAMIASLAERFERHRALVIAEFVVSSSLFAAMAPVTVACVVNLGLPWRVSLVVPFAVLALGCWLTKCGGGATWTLHKAPATSSKRLPANYWLYFAITFLCVAAEWSITFWCPDYLEHALHFQRADACTALSIYLVAMLIGRVLGSRLASTGATNKLLVGASVIATGAFFLFWCGHHAISVMAGLIIFSLAESNCYPLALAAAIGSAPGRTAEATSKMSISTGSAILLAPLFLGVAADRIGITNAYGIVGILLVTATMAAAYALATMQPSTLGIIDAGDESCAAVPQLETR